MPFGRIFAAVFFVGLWAWAGVSRLGAGTATDRLSGAGLVLVGLSLAAALLARRGWARWAGVVGAAVTAVAALDGGAFSSEATSLVALLASAAAAVLLVVPATGRADRSTARGPRFGWVECGAAAGVLALAAAWWIAPGAPLRAAGSDAAAALPASSLLHQPLWTDFDTALARARAEDRPVLVTFVAGWCQYCNKMRRETWTAASVLDRLSGVVPVRVDAERNQALAARFGVEGFPVQILLAPDGSVLARAEGYQSAQQLVAWLDRALAGRRVASGGARRTSG